MKLKRLASFGTAVFLSLSSLLVFNVSHVFAASYTCTWTGGGGDANFSTDANWSMCNGAAPQASDTDDLVFDTGTTTYNNPNNDIVNLTVGNISFTGSSNVFWYSLTGNPITITGGVTDSTTSGSTGITNTLTVSGDQTFSSATNTNYSNIDGSNNITAVGPGSISISEASDNTGGLTTYTGTISSTDSQIVLNTYSNFTSSGAIVISGTAALTLFNEGGRGGNATWNLPVSLGGSGISHIGPLNLEGSFGETTDTLAGAVDLSSDIDVTTDGNATLNLTGPVTENGFKMTSQGANVATINVLPGDNDPSLTATVGNDVTYVIDGTRGTTTVNGNGTLKGTGTVGDLTVQSGGKVAPGHSPGCLNTGNLTLSGSLDEEIGGTTACSGYDQIKVTGTVNVSGGTLNTILYNGYKPKAGEAYTIIDNDSNDAVTGTFAGLAEGATFTNGGNTFKITYVGGDGNDVVLSVQSVPVVAVPTAPNTGFKLLTTQPIAIFITTIALTGGMVLAARRYNRIKT